MAVNCIRLVPIWGRFGDSYLGECHGSYNEWWKIRHGDVGGQPGDNNEHCDLRGCASRPIGRFSPPPWTRSRGESELAGKRVVLPPPSRTIHNARGESPGITWYRYSSPDLVSLQLCDFNHFFENYSFQRWIFNPVLMIIKREIDITFDQREIIKSIVDNKMLINFCQFSKLKNLNPIIF